MSFQSFDEKLHLAARAVNGEVQQAVNLALTRCWPGEKLSLQRLRARRIGATTWYHHPANNSLVAQVDEFSESRRTIVEKGKWGGRSSKRYVVDPPRKVWTVYYPHGPEGESITAVRSVFERKRGEVVLSHVASVIRFAEPRRFRHGGKSTRAFHEQRDYQRTIARKAERAYRLALSDPNMAEANSIGECPPPLEYSPKVQDERRVAAGNGVSVQYVRGAKRETRDYRAPAIDDVAYQRVIEAELRLPARLASQRVNHPTGGYTTVQQQAAGTFRVVRHAPSGSRIWQKTFSGFDEVDSLGAETTARSVSPVGYTPTDHEVRDRSAKRAAVRDFRDEVLVATHPSARAAYEVWEQQTLSKMTLEPLLRSLRCTLGRLEQTVKLFQSDIRMMVQLGANDLVQLANAQFDQALRLAVESVASEGLQLSKLTAPSTNAGVFEEPVQSTSINTVSYDWAAVKVSLMKVLPGASEWQCERLEAALESLYASLLQAHKQASESVDTLMGNFPVSMKVSGHEGREEVECWQIPNSFAVFSNAIKYVLSCSQRVQVPSEGVVSVLDRAKEAWSATDPVYRQQLVIEVIEELRKQVWSAVYASKGYLGEERARADAENAVLYLRDRFESAKVTYRPSRSVSDGARRNRRRF